jgi:acylphosphatase
MRQVRLRIEGKVQGVFFRHHVRSLARTLKLSGYVKNLDDGAVEVVACGNPTAIYELIEYCRHGPEGADVKHLKRTEEVSTGEFKGFEVRF